MPAGQSKPRSRRFVRSFGLVGHWVRNEFFLEHPARGLQVKAPEFSCQLLALFSEPRTIAEVTQALPLADRKLARRVIGEMRDCQLLCPANTVQPDEGGWGTWGPVPRLFHYSTRDVAWIKPAHRLRREKVVASRPAASAGTTSAVLTPQVLALSSRVRSDQFPAVLKSRRTWREFGAAPIPEASFAALMNLSFGVQAKALTTMSQRIALKTSPSPGATQSLETYVAVLHVKGVAPGLYWYNAEKNALCRLRGGVSAKAVGEWLGGQWWFEGAGAVVFLSGVLARIQRRYENPRAYRSWLLEAGHVCQTFCLTATWLKLAPFCTQALADSKIEKRLGIDPARETVLYAMGVGTRRPGKTLGSWPEDHVEGNPFLSRRGGRGR